MTACNMTATLPTSGLRKSDCRHMHAPMSFARARRVLQPVGPSTLDLHENAKVAGSNGGHKMREEDKQ